MMTLRDLVLERIRDRGPLTVAEYMDLALYHPERGYYARADRRSGRAGDFFTAPDVGPVFGELVARQIAEMWRLLRHDAPDGFDLVEAGAGAGQLAADILDGLERSQPDAYAAVRLALVDRSPAARAAQPATLGRHAARLVASGPSLPSSVRGVILANELLDALPCHVLVCTEAGPREIYVDAEGSRLFERTGPLSTPALGAFVAELPAPPRPGWRFEINLAAAQWVTEAARALEGGFLILVDYGHEAAELYSAAHATGTLTTFRRHVVDRVPGRDVRTPPWLADPGTCDMTAHVDLTAVRQAAEREGLITLGILDQTYFLLGLGAVDAAAASTGDTVADLRRRLALKTLLLPGGLGSTHKVLLFGRGVGQPLLQGCSYRVRVT